MTVHTLFVSMAKEARNRHPWHPWLAVAFCTVVGCGSSGNQNTYPTDGGDTCSRLLACCTTLPTPSSKQCFSQLPGSGSSAENDAICAILIAPYVQSGACGDSGGKAGGGGAPGADAGRTDAGSPSGKSDSGSAGGKTDAGSARGDSGGGTDAGGNGGTGSGCKSDRDECTGVCVDLLSSPEHCGTCQKSCGSESTCVQGECKILPTKCPCPLESYCEITSNTCKAGCVYDDHCSAGRYCDEVERLCKPGCRNAGECPDNEDPCLRPKECREGECVYPPVGDGTSCPDDSNPCTADICVDGACSHPAGSEGEACADDGNVCTVDICEAGKCTHSASGGNPCEDDENQCTEDLCEAGECTHSSLPDRSACVLPGASDIEHDLCWAGTCQKRYIECSWHEYEGVYYCNWYQDGGWSLPVPTDLVSCEDDAFRMVVDGEKNYEYCAECEWWPHALMYRCWY